LGKLALSTTGDGYLSVTHSFGVIPKSRPRKLASRNVKHRSIVRCKMYFDIVNPLGVDRECVSQKDRQNRLQQSNDLTQGRNHDWKVEGNQGLGPNTGALAQRPDWVLGVGGGCPSRCGSPGVSPPEKFLKNQKLNPAFWWLLAVKFLAFRKLRPRSWGTNTLLVSQLKRWGIRLPRSLWLLRLWSNDPC